MFRHPQSRTKLLVRLSRGYLPFQQQAEWIPGGEIEDEEDYEAHAQKEQCRESKLPEKLPSHRSYKG